MKVSFLLPAKQEFEEAIRSYDQLRLGLGGSFRNEIREALERVKAFPDAWHPLGETIRRCRVRRFPYAIIYQRQSDHLLVLAIAHLRREPTYWQQRQR